MQKLLIILNLLLLLSANSFCLTNSLIVWDYKLNYIDHFDDISFGEISTILKSNIKKAGQYAVYYGSEIDPNVPYLFPYNPFYRSFLYDKLDRNERDSDSLCTPYEDILNDGTWFRFSVANEGEAGSIIAQKTISNQLLEGDYLYFYSDGTLQFKEKYKNGQRVDSTCRYSPDGKLIHLTVYEEYCGIESSYISWNDEGEITGYFDKKLGLYIFLYSGNRIESITPVKNGKSHGTAFYYNEDGCLDQTKKWVNGLMVK